MAGTLTISTLSDGTNSTSATYPIKGSARAWVKFVGSTAVINASFNVSSITRNGTGDYTVNFTTAMPDANYTYAFGLGNGTSAPTGATWTFGSYSTATYLTTSLRLNASYSSGGGSGSFDPNPATVSIFGN